jgi:rubrerythrin
MPAGPSRRVAGPKEDSPLHVDEVFRSLIDFARAMATLYGRWADAFEGDRGAVLFFAKMAREETGHATLVNYQRRVLTKTFPDLAEGSDMAMEEVTMLIDIVQRALDGPPHTLAEAVCLACWIEGSAADTELRSSLTQANPDLRRLLDNIRGDEQRHAERLKAFAVQRGIPLRSPV